MADSAEALILEGLQRAVATPEGLPLLAGKAAPGWFGNQSAGKQAAQVSRERGYVQVVRTETKGRATVEYCVLSEQGWKHLLDHTSPRPILESLLAALGASQANTTELVEAAHRHEQCLEAIRAAVTRLQEHLQQQAAAPSPPKANGQSAPAAIVRANLEAWSRHQPLGDCPLPELFGRCQVSLPKLSIGRFHDALRSMHDERVLHLHPWTGPLYELPEPAYALLVGHEIAFYASLRDMEPS